VLNNKCRC